MKLSTISIISFINLGLIFTPLDAQASSDDHDAEERRKIYQQLELFAEIMERVESNYVTDIDSVAAISAAINGMLGSLDPHSRYLSPEEASEAESRQLGEYGGIGIEITVEEGFVKIISPFDNTPASRAGLKTGDFISGVEGESIVGMSQADAVRKMRGKPGEPIRLTILRADEEPFEITLVREIIRPDPVTHRIEGDVGYIRISSFNAETTSSMHKTLSDLGKALGKHPKGIIIDVRNNPGGDLFAAINTAGFFLDGGEVVSTRGRAPTQIDRYNAEPGEFFRDIPMIVMINRGSASASEIVAGALQDRGRAKVLGLTSFGKASVQRRIPLDERGALHLTMARYYTPAGRSIQGIGVKPDITVSQTILEEDDLETLANTFSEASLPNALNNDEGFERPTPELPQFQPPESYEGNDYQLEKALEILRSDNLLSFSTNIDVKPNIERN